MERQLASTSVACSLEVDGARVWVVRADASPDPTTYALLDGTERARALGLRFEADRRAYVLAHALRRRVLGSLVGRDPASLCFMHDTRGRPRLVEPHVPGLFFSHAHTREAVAFAMGSRDVGVDIEPEEIANADFPLLESFIESVTCPMERTAAGFATAWTALEAFWKAQGTGLADGQPRIKLISLGDQQRLCCEVVGNAAAYAPADIHLTRRFGCMVAVALLRKECSALD